MSSDSARAHARVEASGVRRLVGSSFGFLVWAAHLLVVYVAEAVACQLSVVSVMSPDAGLIVSLAAATALAALIVVAHGWRLWRQRRADGEQGFLARVAVGQDAIATLAILWQLIPLFTVPLCR
jgi:hypothetical protein